MYIEFEYLAPTVCFDDNKVMLRRSALRSIVLHYYCILSILMDLFKHNALAICGQFDRRSLAIRTDLNVHTHYYINATRINTFGTRDRQRVV
jgi:hypothetical protein